VQPIYAGYYLWRGAPNEADLSLQTQKTIFPYFSFYLGKQMHTIGYPFRARTMICAPGIGAITSAGFASPIHRS